MKALLTLLFLLLPLTACAAKVESFIHQGIDRQYRIHNVKAASDGAAPIVIHLHGLRYVDEVKQGRKTFDHVAWKPMEKVAEDNGFVLVQPGAYWGRWNLFPGLDHTKLENGDDFDDDGYIFGVVDELIRKGVADKNRIYVSGISDGATLVIKLVCHTDSPFAAAVHLVGSLPDQYMADCKSAKPTPFMAIAGTTDRILPYDGRLSQYGRSLPIPELMEFWRLKHKCTGQSYDLLDDRDTEDQSRVLAVTWTGCSTDGAVKLLRAEGGGHVVPSYTSVPEGRVKRWGGHNRDIESAAEVWRFVSKFSLNTE